MCIYETTKIPMAGTPYVLLSDTVTLWKIFLARLICDWWCSRSQCSLESVRIRWGSVRSDDAIFCVGSHTKLSHVVGETMDTSAQLWALVLVGQPRVHSWDLILPLTGFFLLLLAGPTWFLACASTSQVTSFNSKMQQSFYMKVCKVLWIRFYWNLWAGQNLAENFSGLAGSSQWKWLSCMVLRWICSTTVSVTCVAVADEIPAICHCGGCDFYQDKVKVFMGQSEDKYWASDKIVSCAISERINTVSKHKVGPLLTEEEGTALADSVVMLCDDSILKQNQLP